MNELDETNEELRERGADVKTAWGSLIPKWADVVDLEERTMPAWADFALGRERPSAETQTAEDTEEISAPENLDGVTNEERAIILHYSQMELAAKSNVNHIPDIVQQSGFARLMYWVALKTDWDLSKSRKKLLQAVVTPFASAFATATGASDNTRQIIKYTSYLALENACQQVAGIAAVWAACTGIACTAINAMAYMGWLTKGATLAGVGTYIFTEFGPTLGLSVWGVVLPFLVFAAHQGGMMVVMAEIKESSPGVAATLNKVVIPASVERALDNLKIPKSWYPRTVEQMVNFLASNALTYAFSASKTRYSHVTGKAEDVAFLSGHNFLNFLISKGIGFGLQMGVSALMYPVTALDKSVRWTLRQLLELPRTTVQLGKNGASLLTSAKRRVEALLSRTRNQATDPTRKFLEAEEDLRKYGAIMEELANGQDNPYFRTIRDYLRDNSAAVRFARENPGAPIPERLAEQDAVSFRTSMHRGILRQMAQSQAGLEQFMTKLQQEHPLSPESLAITKQVIRTGLTLNEDSYWEYARTVISDVRSHLSWRALLIPATVLGLGVAASFLLPNMGVAGFTQLAKDVYGSGILPLLDSAPVRYVGNMLSPDLGQLLLYSLVNQYTGIQGWISRMVDYHVGSRLRHASWLDYEIKLLARRDANDKRIPLLMRALVGIMIPKYRSREELMSYRDHKDQLYGRRQLIAAWRERSGFVPPMEELAKLSMQAIYVEVVKLQKGGARVTLGILSAAATKMLAQALAPRVTSFLLSGQALSYIKSVGSFLASNVLVSTAGLTGLEQEALQTVLSPENPNAEVFAQAASVGQEQRLVDPAQNKDPNGLAQDPIYQQAAKATAKIRRVLDLPDSANASSSEIGAALRKHHQQMQDDLQRALPDAFKQESLNLGTSPTSPAPVLPTVPVQKTSPAPTSVVTAKTDTEVQLGGKIGWKPGVSLAQKQLTIVGSQVADNVLGEAVMKPVEGVRMAGLVDATAIYAAKKAAARGVTGILANGIRAGANALDPVVSTVVSGSLPISLNGATSAVGELVANTVETGVAEYDAAANIYNNYADVTAVYQSSRALLRATNNHGGATLNLIGQFVPKQAKLAQRIPDSTKLAGEHVRTLDQVAELARMDVKEALTYTALKYAAAPQRTAAEASLLVMETIALGKYSGSLFNKLRRVWDPEKARFLDDIIALGTDLGQQDLRRLEQEVADAMYGFTPVPDDPFSSIAMQAMRPESGLVFPPHDPDMVSSSSFTRATPELNLVDPTTAVCPRPAPNTQPSCKLDMTPMQEFQLKLHEEDPSFFPMPDISKEGVESAKEATRRAFQRLEGPETYPGQAATSAVTIASPLLSLLSSSS